MLEDRPALSMLNNIPAACAAFLACTFTRWLRF
jgi:hypothetical protein